MDDLASRLFDEDRRVVNDGPLKVRRETALQALHGLQDRFLDVETVGICQLRNHDRRRGLAIQLRRPAIVFATQFDATDILDPYDRTVGIGPDNDIAELFDLREPAERGQLILERLIVRRRRLSELARGDIAVLLHDGIAHVRGGQAEIGQAGGIQPDPNRILVEPEVVDLGYPRDPRDRIDQMDIRVVLQKISFVRAVR